MQLEKLYYRAIFVSIIIGHLLAGLQFWLKREELETPKVWVSQFYFLLAVSLLLSLLLFVYRNTVVVGKVLFLVKILVFVIIGYGEGGYLGVEFTLLTLLILEISAYFRLIQSIIITSVVTTITLLSQGPIYAWHIALPGASFHDLLSLSIYGCIVAVLANIVRELMKRLDVQTQAADRLDKAVSQLIDANLGFQQYAVTASEQSAGHERKRIARDIHDTAVHILVNIIMLAESALDLIEPDMKKLSRILQQIITQAKEAVRDTRRALRELRAIEESSPKGLKAIHHLVKVFEEATGVQVDIEFGNVPWVINEDIDQILYRMIQEGLTNAFRHGKATLITIRLWIFNIRTDYSDSR